MFNKLIEVIRDYRLRGKYPTHLYITPDACTRLIDEPGAVRFAADKIIGLDVVITTMPENVAGEFFVAG